jgi:hypothetical protein
MWIALLLPLSWKILGRSKSRTFMLLVIKLVNSDKKFTKTMLVRVVHATPQASGTFLVGGTLETPLTYEELCALVM